MRPFKTFFGLLGFTAVIVLSFYIISDIEKTPDVWNPREAASIESESRLRLNPGPIVTIPATPRPALEAEFMALSEICDMAYMFFHGEHDLPVWFSMGLVAYFLGSDAAPLANEDLTLLLSQAKTGPPFGDAWLVPSLMPRGVTVECIHNVAYTIVRRWSQAGSLQAFFTLAQDDTFAFSAKFCVYVAELTGMDNLPGMHFQYRHGDFKAVTNQGKYIFVYDNYDWVWGRVLDFILYMDTATQFIRDYFSVSNTDYIRVTVYPFGVIDIPDVIAEMAYAFGWDASDINFVANDEIVLASTARFGTWAMSHEVTHILLFREFVDYNPPTWLIEGMAVLGELLFREAFDGTVTYRVSVPRLSNIDNLARRGGGHILPLAYYEATFGRGNWTYDDVGSFMLYLYNNFGIEALLAMYRADNDSQFEMALEIFGKELEALMYSWRRNLWRGAEPEGWWAQ